MILNPVLGSKKLPVLTNPGAAADLRKGKQLVDQYGDPLTGTMPELAAATYTPGTADQVIPDGTYLAGKQTIKGDANHVPENIRAGRTLFGVAGSYTGPNMLLTYVNGVEFTKSGTTATLKLFFAVSLDVLSKWFAAGSAFPDFIGSVIHVSGIGSDAPGVIFDPIGEAIVLYAATNRSITYTAEHLTDVSVSPYAASFSMLTLQKTATSTTLGYFGNSVDYAPDVNDVLLVEKGTLERQG